VCRLTSPLNAPRCAQCGHQFRTHFAPNQTTVVAPQVPPAPTPPTFWEQFKNPLAATKYRAELMAYYQQNGLITPAIRNLAVLLMTIAVAVIIVGFVIETVSSVISQRHMDESLDRSMRRPQPDYNTSPPQVGANQ
jgi:hypothetical protein